LFCSREEEEGLNLHFCDIIIHLDLPFDPSRIEQRIGRLDRYGRRSEVKHWIVLPNLNTEMNLWLAWFEVLAEGFKIFNESISDVQIKLDSLLDNLKSALISGTEDLINSKSTVSKFLFEEREKLEDQYSLDQVLQEEASAYSLFADLDNIEDQEEEISEANFSWISKCLKFRYVGDPGGIFKIEWEMNKKRPRPLLPLIPWAKMFGEGLQSQHTNFRRNVAGRRFKERTQILRVGNQLLDAFYEYLKIEDRGTAFATWKKILPPGMEEYMYFKLCYVITHEFPDGVNENEKKRLKSRMISYFPISTSVIYVDQNFNVQTSKKIIDILSAPYRPEENSDSKSDYNLSNNPELLFNYVDIGVFKKMCTKIRKESEQWLIGQSDFQEVIKNFVTNGNIDISLRNNRLLQKKKNILLQKKSDNKNTYDNETILPELEREIEINEEILKVLGKPKIKLDAIGTIILSSRSPEEFAMEGI
jgi:ATP-dependent helicase HepA